MSATDSANLQTVADALTGLCSSTGFGYGFGLGLTLMGGWLIWAFMRNVFEDSDE